jgi:sigma-E factor negative regulatory protein RseC
MIEESARVVGIEGTQLVLEAEIKTSCQSCTAKKGCGTALLSEHVGRKMTRFHAENSLNARIGDEVIVGLSEQAMLNGSLLVYLFPLVCMILAALLADALLDPAWLSAQGLSADLLTALAAMAGLVLAMLAVRNKFAGRHSQQLLTPVVLRKKLTLS